MNEVFRMYTLPPVVGSEQIEDSAKAGLHLPILSGSTEKKEEPITLDIADVLWDAGIDVCAAGGKAYIGG